LSKPFSSSVHRLQNSGLLLSHLNEWPAASHQQQLQQLQSERCDSGFQVFVVYNCCSRIVRPAPCVRVYNWLVLVCTSLLIGSQAVPLPCNLPLYAVSEFCTLQGVNCLHNHMMLPFEASLET